MNFKISEFCRLLGVSTDTLRYYERCELLTTQKNPDNSYRTFSQQVKRYHKFGQYALVVLESGTYLVDESKE